MKFKYNPMKFKYNPTLDRLLLVARYAQAGKTKKLEKILRGIATENTYKDIKSLNRLQSRAAQERANEDLRDDRIVSIGLTSNSSGSKIIAAWSNDIDADRIYSWWPKGHPLPDIQLLAYATDNLRMYGLSSKEMTVSTISMRQVNSMVEGMLLWDDGSVDFTTSKKKLLRSFKNRYRH